jgi:hypothetical protein
VPLGLLAVVACVAGLRAAGLPADPAVLAGLVVGAMATVPLAALVTARRGRPGPASPDDRGPGAPAGR